MPTKLTLRLNPFLIKKAKRYAKHHATSVSQLVEGYFLLLSQRENATESISHVSLPITQSLRGVLKGMHMAEEDYKKHLEDKYL